MSFLCSLFKHEYYVHALPVEEWATGIRWLKCRRCKENFAMNDKVKTVLPMDDELKNLHKWKATKETK